MQIERALACDVDGALDRAGPAREATLLLVRAAQVRERRRRKPAVDLVERATGAHRGERGGERPLRSGGVVHVVGRDDVDPRLGRDQRELVVAVAVDGVAVVPQLDEHAVTTERRDQVVERAPRRRRPVAQQGRGHGALAAPGEHEPRGVGRGRRRVEVHRRVRGVGERGDGGAGRALLSRELRLADRAREPRVPDRPSREHDQVLATRVRLPVGGLLDAEGEFRAEDGGEAVLLRGQREADRAVEAVVVGDRQCREPEPRRLHRQILGMARAVEEGEIGVAVELRVADHAEDGSEHMFDQASADDDFGYLTTRGRRTGEPHKIEIWFAADGDTLYLLAGARDRSDWVRNLRAEPAVTFRVRDITYPGTGRVIADAAEERRARTLVFDKYQPRNRGSLEGWRESALPVAIDLAGCAATSHEQSTERS